MDRKVTLLTRTLSDLISQVSSVTDTDLSNTFAISGAMMTPYASTPVQAKISQIYIDPSTLVAKVKWSKASNATPRSCNEVVAIPAGIAVGGTYLIMSEVTYNYKPVVGYNIATSFVSPTFALSERTFTRPRQSSSVTYSTAPACT